MSDALLRNLHSITDPAELREFVRVLAEEQPEAYADPDIQAAISDQRTTIYRARIKAAHAASHRRKS